MKTKAAVLFELGKPLEVITIEVPPLHEGQVLVKLAYSGVCHSQLMEIRGKRGNDKYLPHLLGHEGSGVVLEIGENVTKVKPGDKVILGWIKGSGLNVNGGQYKYKDALINGGAVTTFNEFSIVSENRCVPLPKAIPLDIAVLFGCAIPTGSGIITNTIKPKPGSSIAIFGLGGIGLSALMATKLYNLRTIVAIDINNEKLKLAEEFGATHIINAKDANPLIEIRKITNGLGIDYSVESSGIAKTIELAFDSVKRNGGLCVFASHPQFGEKICLEPYELICGKNIKGSWGGDSKPDLDIPKFAELYKTGKLPLEKFFSKVYKLEEINEALDDLENHRVARPLIIIDPNIE